MKLSDYAKKEGISYSASYRRFKNGKIPNSIQDPKTGSVFIKEEDTSWKDDLILLQKEKIKSLEETIEKLKSAKK
jgi:predicted site-specific integrase-resolvase